MKVHILATCRQPDLIPAALMVFDTLRLGFPNADVSVDINRVDGLEDEMDVIKNKAALARSSVAFVQTIHHEWLEALCMNEPEPFVALDTDIIFWERCDHWEFAHPLAGRYIPHFRDPFTKCLTRSRLHGSFLWVKPVELRAKIAAYHAGFPGTPFNPPANLFYPFYMPMRGQSYFHDTGCLLYHAIGGHGYSERELDAYSHLNCGTISDIVAPHMPEECLRESHFAVFNDRELARGCWRDQDAFYARHQ